MPLLVAPPCDFEQPAPDFALVGVDGRLCTRDQCCGDKGLLVMFICNHCPCVQAIRGRLIQDMHELMTIGIGCVAIMSNDPADYPEDNLENMRRVATEYAYPFPYLFDETQAIGQTYGAVCTPDFFGYNAELKLQYRGRLDASRQATVPPETRRELLEAMRQVALTGRGPIEQIPSSGCSIKWRN